MADMLFLIVKCCGRRLAPRRLLLPVAQIDRLGILSFMLWRGDCFLTTPALPVRAGQ